MDRFWMVWSPTGRTPTFKHDSEESARNEAERLARNTSPGEKFYILEAKAVVERPELPVTWTDLDDPNDIPL